MPPDAAARAWRLAALAAVAVPILLILAGLAPMFRALAALLLAVLPGYLITWPSLRPRFGAAGAFVVAGAVSIGMIVIGGLLLNLLPWGLQAASWVAYLAVLAGIAVALDRPRLAWRPRIVGMSHELLLGGIGATMLVVALLFARLFAAVPSESFTQLWVAPAANLSGSAQIGVRCNEQAATGYRLEVLFEGAPITSVPDIELAPGQTWTQTVTAGVGRLEVRLFRLSDPGTVYRYVTVLLGAPTPGASASGAPAGA